MATLFKVGGGGGSTSAATLKVTAPSGATVTAELNGKTTELVEAAGGGYLHLQGQASRNLQRDGSDNGQ